MTARRGTFHPISRAAWEADERRLLENGYCSGRVGSFGSVDDGPALHKLLTGTYPPQLASSDRGSRMGGSPAHTVRAYGPDPRDPASCVGWITDTAALVAVLARARGEEVRLELPDQTIIGVAGVSFSCGQTKGWRVRLRASWRRHVVRPAALPPSPRSTSMRPVKVAPDSFAAQPAAAGARR